ncbi:hypothetical protein [Kocuria sabuli]|uniref:hypothetical protein n=1 Tax=Kocuria sabuli TaxID=3071448 RepID=UPI0034D78B06
MEEHEGQGALSDRPVLPDPRHPQASWPLARNVPVHAVSARFGHESVTTTVVTHGHLVDDADRLAADARG